MSHEFALPVELRSCTGAGTACTRFSLGIFIGRAIPAPQLHVTYMGAIKVNVATA